VASSQGTLHAEDKADRKGVAMLEKDQIRGI
jgi:hypothetical protein